MAINWLQETEKRRELLLQQLTKLCSIESVLDESTANPGAPFGEKIAEALSYMLKLGEAAGFTTKNIDGYAGHIEMGKGEELVGVLAHLDVVPTGDGWISPPFEPEIREGNFFARGAQDDKGAAMAAFVAMQMVKELDLPLSKRVRLILGTDEESHWRDMDYYFEREKMPDMGFTPDADFPIITAEKGMIDFTLTGKVDTNEAPADGWLLESFEAGQRFNMVPDLAQAQLQGDGDVFELKEKYQDFLLSNRIQGYAEESNDHLTLVLEGKAHHGSEPEGGLNAALRLAEFLSSISLDTTGSQYIRFIAEKLCGSFKGEKLNLAQSDDRVGPLTVNGGIFRYQIGGEQGVGLNIRYPISGELTAIRQQMETEAESFGFTVEVVDHKKGHFVDEDHQLVRTLSRVYEEQTGEKGETMAIGGATYARALETGVVFGPLFPGREETAHQRNEYIVVDDLVKATALYAQAIYELAK
ncbi:dipeptidase PepV [Marininema halotolerans]|uniref:Succinyl-diaminopimelate desuccinylase n=1 Tax=Marininema halotolerans TaxID=1155944 RepID=A0A1I6Q3E8_9BACL|nr:dipeptidase PepV [Marininema halotolerans]SFS46868.1 succinyl-diaminopimelate desuccinylase [Marininema halotolerans]